MVIAPLPRKHRDTEESFFIGPLLNRGPIARENLMHSVFPETACRCNPIRFVKGFEAYGRGRCEVVIVKLKKLAPDLEGWSGGIP